jgi:DNA-binding MarR family transcriptional regulator
MVYRTVGHKLNIYSTLRVIQHTTDRHCSVLYSCSMIPHQKSLSNYFDRIAGVAVPITSVAPPPSLPLFIRQQFSFAAAEIFGRRIVLAVELTPPEELSANEYARSASFLRDAFGELVVLVMAKLPSYMRSRLVQKCVPFVVPNAQMFLPMLMIDFRERQTKGASPKQDTLLPVSQLVVIYQILRQPTDYISLAQLGEHLAYSPQSMSSAQEQLQEAGICEVRRNGRAIFLDFRVRGRALWEKAEPLMASPVRKTQWIRWGQTRARAVVAGISALSRNTMLAEDPVETYAMRERNVIAALDKGQLIGCNGREDADARMESWKYDPWVVAENGVADRYSLYLSLRNSGDERVQKELKLLLERLPP